MFYKARTSSQYFIATFVIMVIALLVACSEQQPSTASATNASKILSDNADGLLIKFIPEYAGDWELRHAVLDSMGLTEVSSLGGLAPAWFRVVQKNTDISIQHALKTVVLVAGVEKAEPNYLVYAHNTQPNDTYFSRQLSLHNTGQGAGLEDVDIDAPEAWDILNGGPVVVAVLDSGIDINHPDLANNIWINNEEVEDNGVDDDQNGFIDDYKGWNFVSSVNVAGDESGHGTHVAGIIGATTDNKEGIAGINRFARLMPVKFLDSNGVGSVYLAIRALSYAVDNGAMLSNLSWGTDHYSDALFEAIQQAGVHQHIVVASAGNDARSLDDEPVYPAAYALSNIISVAASNERGQLASFSNYSQEDRVLAAAPGVGIFSTNIRDKLQDDQPIGYAVMSGTSAAAAHVSGVVSLLLTQDNRPDPWQIKQAIFNSVDINSVFTDKVASGGMLNAFGVLNQYVDSILTIENPVEEVSPPESNAGANDMQDIDPSNTALPDESTAQDDSVAPPAEEGSIANDIVPGDVRLSPSTLEIAIGDQFQLMAEGGAGSLSWESSDLFIGTVDDAGMFTAKNKGETQIVAWDENGVQSNVMTILVTSLSLSPTELAMLTVGESLEVNLSGGVGPFDWRISSNGSPASLSVDINDSRVAIVDALQPGSFQIEVTDTASTSVLSFSSSPIQVLATNVSIDVPNSTTLLVGETLDLSVSSTSPNISWSTSDSNVALIDETTGVVTAITKGTVTIIARDEFGQSDSFVLTVNVLPIKITPPVNDTIWVGNSNQLQLLVSGGLAPYTWQSATPWIASVDSDGLVSSVDFPVAQLADASQKSTIFVSDASGSSTSVDITVNKAFVSSPLSALTINQTVTLETFIAGNIQSHSVSGAGGVYVDQALASVRGERSGDVVVSIVDALGNTATTQTISINTLPLVIMEPSTRDLWLGNGESISLTARDGQGPYLWSSDTVDVASVDESSGLVTGLSEGVAVIRVTDDLGNSNAITLSIKKLTIDPVVSAVYAYDKLHLSAIAYGELSWSISDGSIANIDQFGLLSATSAGSVTVNVTDALLNSASITITVLPLQTLSIEATTQQLWIGNGNTTQLSAVGGKSAYSWSSDTPSVAVVDAKGLVTAVSTGNAQIRVTDSVGNTTAISISIKQISLSAPSTSIEAYAPLQLTGFGSGSLTWSVSSVGASVTQDGLLSTTASGNVTVTVTDMLNNSASVVITVTPLAQLVVTDVTTTELWIGNGSTAQLTAVGGKAPYVWSSTDVGTVNVSAAGQVSAVAVGSASIIVTDDLGATYPVNFNVDQIRLSSPVTTITVGDQLQMLASGYGTLNYSVSNVNASIDQNGLLTANSSGTVIVNVSDGLNNIASVTLVIEALQPLSIQNPATKTLWLGNGNTTSLEAVGGKAPYSWSVSNNSTGIVSVDQSGKVIALDTGDATVIVADAFGNVDTITLTVKQVSLTANNYVVEEGSTVQLNPVGAGSFSWNVSGSGQASVNGSTYVLTAISPGTVSVAMTDANGTNASTSITILAIPDLVIQSGVNTSLWLGNANTVQLNADGGKGGYSWSVISGSSVVSVSSNGFVTAQSVGSATIRVSDQSGRSDSINISVSRVSISGSSSITVTVGDQVQFYGNGFGSLSWSVSQSSLASISNGGLFTALSAGTVSVSVTDENNNTSAPVSVQINAPAPTGGGGGGMGGH